MGKKFQRIVLLLSILMGFSMIFIASSNSKNPKSIMNNELQITDWNLPYVIVIDNNWSDTRDMYDWCYGLGSIEQPYIIENITINSQNGGSCIKIHNTTEYFVIRNCKLYNASNYINTGGITLLFVENGTIERNDISNNGNFGIFLESCENIKIIENEFTDNGDDAVFIDEDSLKNYLIRNYFKTSSAHYHGVDILGDNNTIEKNTFDGKKIKCRGSYNIINMNTLRSTYLPTGITILYENYNKIINNIIIGGWQHSGISIQYSSYNEIINNTMSGFDIGIRFSDTGGNYAEFNSVLNNIIENANIGIMMFLESNNNNISGNHIKSNNKGIKLEESTENNLIYTNKIEDNQLNAEDRGLNKWNNSEIGNFWDDYAGVDEDDNNIGDTPYLINGSAGSKDFLPIFNRPGFIIDSPIDNSYWNKEPLISIKSTDPNLNSTWYTCRDQIEYIQININESLRSDIWNSLPEGSFVMNFYANDSSGAILEKYENTLIKDITTPLMNVIDPYIYAKRSFIQPPTIRVNISDLNLYSYWYSLNNQPYRYNFSVIEQPNNFERICRVYIDESIWNDLPYGNVTITFYADDKAGNAVSKRLFIIKGGESHIIDGFLISFLLLGIFSISIILIKQLFKRKFSFS